MSPTLSLRRGSRKTDPELDVDQSDDADVEELERVLLIIKARRRLKPQVQRGLRRDQGEP